MNSPEATITQHDILSVMLFRIEDDEGIDSNYIKGMYDLIMLMMVKQGEFQAAAASSGAILRMLLEAGQIALDHSNVISFHTMGAN